MLQTSLCFPHQLFLLDLLSLNYTRCRVFILMWGKRRQISCLSEFTLYKGASSKFYLCETNAFQCNLNFDVLRKSQLLLTLPSGKEWHGGLKLLKIGLGWVESPLENTFLLKTISSLKKRSKELKNKHFWWSSRPFVFAEGYTNFLCNPKPNK